MGLWGLFVQLVGGVFYVSIVENIMFKCGGVVYLGCYLQCRKFV